MMMSNFLQPKISNQEYFCIIEAADSNYESVQNK